MRFSLCAFLTHVFSRGILLYGRKYMKIRYTMAIALIIGIFFCLDFTGIYNRSFNAGPHCLRPQATEEANTAFSHRKVYYMRMTPHYTVLNHDDQLRSYYREASRNVATLLRLVSSNGNVVEADDAVLNLGYGNNPLELSSQGYDRVVNVDKGINPGAWRIIGPPAGSGITREDFERMVRVQEDFITDPHAFLENLRANDLLGEDELPKVVLYYNMALYFLAYMRDFTKAIGSDFAPNITREQDLWITYSHFLLRAWEHYVAEGGYLCLVQYMPPEGQESERSFERNYFENAIHAAERFFDDVAVVYEVRDPVTDSVVALVFEKGTSFDLPVEIAVASLAGNS